MKREAVFTAYVRGDGKLTVPKSVRDSLDIAEEDLVECKICKVKSARRALEARTQVEGIVFDGKSDILVRSEIVRAKAKAVRRGVWFRVLTRTERACVDLAVMVVDRVRSGLLRKVLWSVLGKLEAALENRVQRLVLGVGVGLALRLSQVAQKWGNRSAAGWVKDAGFVRFLAVSHLNSALS